MESSKEDISIFARVRQLLSSSELSDIEFFVGDKDKGQTFPAHRFILALMSDVFRAMLYGPLAETEKTIRVDDIEPEGFRTMLRFIYTDQTQLTSISHAFDTAMAANKYLIAGLRDRCINFISSKLNSQNVCTILEFSNLLDVENLKKNCRGILRKPRSAMAAIQSEDFLNCRLPTVEQVLKLAPVRLLFQLPLFQSLEKWSRAECARQGLLPEEGLRQIIDPFLPKIDFLLMTSEEFADGPAKSGVLTQDEKFAFLMNLASRGSVELPPWAGSAKETLKLVESSKPDRRKTAYDFFVDDCRKEHKKQRPNGTAESSDFSRKECANKWRKLPETSKCRFYQKETIDYERYDCEMAICQRLAQQKERKRKWPDNETTKKPWESRLHWSNLLESCLEDHDAAAATFKICKKARKTSMASKAIKKSRGVPVMHETEDETESFDEDSDSLDHDSLDDLLA